MKNKRAAFEMSITTVVIIVIAIIMLVMGIVLTQKIMCGAMNIADTTLEGAEKEVEKLFSSSTTENVRCQGIEKPITIVPGKYNIIGCGIKNEDETKDYVYEWEIIDVDSPAINKREAKEWLKGSTKGTIRVGTQAIKTLTIPIQPPKATPKTLITLKSIIKTPDELIYEENLIYIIVENPGWVANSIC